MLFLLNEAVFPFSQIDYDRAKNTDYRPYI